MAGRAGRARAGRSRPAGGAPPRRRSRARTRAACRRSPDARATRVSTPGDLGAYLSRAPAANPLSAATRSSPSGAEDANGATATASPIASARARTVKRLTTPPPRGTARSSARRSATAIRSGRVASTALTAATVTTASPDPDQRVHAEHRRQHGAQRHRPRDAELQRRRRGARHHRQPRAAARDGQERRAGRPRPPQHAATASISAADAERADHAHVEHVRAERGDAAVGEHEACVASTTAITRHASQGRAGPPPAPPRGRGRWCLPPPGS